jgi:hypothetical protein
VFRARFSQFEALIDLSEIISFLDVSPMKNPQKRVFRAGFSQFEALIDLMRSPFVFRRFAYGKYQKECFAPVLVSFRL